TAMIAGSISGNAATVTSGVYTTGMYADPAWITSLSGAKIAGAVASATNATTAVNFTGALAGDVTGTQAATTVGRLQGVTVSAVAPVDLQVLQYNAAAAKWQAAALPPTGVS